MKQKRGGSKEVDITGRKYSMLTAIKPLPIEKGAIHRSWLFRCDCGKEIARIKGNVTNGGTTNCGCNRGEANITHGHLVGKYNSRYEGKYKLPDLYVIWVGFKQRCYNRNAINYSKIGGLGIKVVNRWLDYGNFYNDVHESYEKFLKENGKKQTNFTRIDWTKDYGPDNFKWDKPNNIHRRDADLLHYVYKGKNYTVKELEGAFKIKRSLLDSRLRRGMTIEEAIEGYGEGHIRKIKDTIVADANYYKANKAKFQVLNNNMLSIIEYMYGGDYPMTLVEGGRHFGVTRERIRQVLKIAFFKVNKLIK